MASRIHPDLVMSVFSSCLVSTFVEFSSWIRIHQLLYQHFSFHPTEAWQERLYTYLCWRWLSSYSNQGCMWCLLELRFGSPLLLPWVRDICEYWLHFHHTVKTLDESSQQVWYDWLQGYIYTGITKPTVECFQRRPTPWSIDLSQPCWSIIVPHVVSPRHCLCGESSMQVHGSSSWQTHCCAQAHIEIHLWHYGLWAYLLTVPLDSFEHIRWLWLGWRSWQPSINYRLMLISWP